jgi:hypothetical protein
MGYVTVTECFWETEIYVLKQGGGRVERLPMKTERG